MEQELALLIMTKDFNDQDNNDEEVLQLTGVPVGFLGPIGLKDCLTQDAKIYYDLSLKEIGDAVTGANKVDYHIQHINIPRDLKLSESDFVDVSTVLEGDACPECSEKMKQLQGIEVGQVFKLGTRYSKPMKLHYLDKEGKKQDVIMGTYGIGVSRTLAACVEQNHDENGIRWPAALAPYQVQLINLDTEGEPYELATKIYTELQSKGVEVLWDDRDGRAGVKFNDADLLGMPLQIVIGKRGIKNGCLEYKIRYNGEKGDIPIDNVISHIDDLIKKLP